MDTNNKLFKLYKDHDGKASDKWTIYMSVYHSALQSFQDKPINFLEIGIQNGGSLEIWGKYFKNAQKIIGCDINPKCGDLKYDDPRTHVLIGDINQPATKDSIMALCPNFDIIIDDGSHKSFDIIASFCEYFPNLNDGGLFIIEDLHCSYWKSYQGGLFAPQSAIQFLKILVDIVNFEHWGLPLGRAEYLEEFLAALNLKISDDCLSHIHSIEFINSMCIIKKASPANNLLGARIIAGNDASVSSDILGLNNTTITVPQQTVE